MSNHISPPILPPLLLFMNRIPMSISNIRTCGSQASPTPSPLPTTHKTYRIPCSMPGLPPQLRCARKAMKYKGTSLLDPTLHLQMGGGQANIFKETSSQCLTVQVQQCDLLSYPTSITITDSLYKHQNPLSAALTFLFPQLFSHASGPNSEAHPLSQTRYLVTPQLQFRN